ncbi:MAG: hypothetical protein OXE53_01615 [Deltaproteobacteria bacterium]|nr:hypothetical protein [Deltaproteobacteria bacterium]
MGLSATQSFSPRTPPISAVSAARSVGRYCIVLGQNHEVNSPSLQVVPDPEAETVRVAEEAAKRAVEEKGMKRETAVSGSSPRASVKFLREVDTSYFART